jgi:hypothetical protein
VGAPRPEHLDYAAEILGAIPEELKTAAREPFGARAVVYTLLLNQDAEPRRNQLARLQRHADPAVFAESSKLAPLVETLPERMRLPLVDMALAALKDLSPQQHDVFRENVAHLVEADQQIDLFEYTLQRTIGRRLDPVFTDKKPGVVQYYGIKGLLPQCAVLLTALAQWGSSEPEAQAAAFRKGAAAIDGGGELVFAGSESVGLAAVDSALNRLGEASAKIRKRVLNGCIACVAADGKVTVIEGELLRAIADALECPVPPILPGQDLAADAA